MLKREYLRMLHFKSETDTEVIVQIIESLSTKDLMLKQLSVKHLSFLKVLMHLHYWMNKMKKRFMLQKIKVRYLVGVGEILMLSQVMQWQCSSNRSIC